MLYCQFLFKAAVLLLTSVEEPPKSHGVQFISGLLLPHNTALPCNRFSSLFAAIILINNNQLPEVIALECGGHRKKKTLLEQMYPFQMLSLLIYTK